MDKIIKFLFLFFLLCSCTNNQKYNNKLYDVIFVYNPYININLNSKILKINYGELQYKDTINFSKEEENAIYDSFERNYINALRGEISYYNDTIRISPPSVFKFKLFMVGKIVSEITVDYNYENKGYIPSGQKYKVVRFRDDVVKILNNNEDIKKALKIFSDYDSNLWRRLKIWRRLKTR